MSAATTSQSEPDAVLKWYTAARRIPRLIGKAPGGGHYWGGPYTITQVLGGVIVLLAGVFTEDVWGGWGWLTDKIILFAVAAATTLALRMVKPGGRNPLSAGLALLGSLSSPSWGAYRGRALKPSPARRVHQQINVRLDPLPVGPCAPPTVPAVEPVPAELAHADAADPGHAPAGFRSAPAMSTIQRRLAGAHHT